MNTSPTSQLLSELRVYTPAARPEERVRLGREGDGGYVLLSEGLQKIEAFYSYGINRDYSFDLDLHRRTGAEGRLFDPTVDYPAAIGRGLSFRKIGLATGEGTISSHVVAFGDSGKRMVLKVDVEGAEWRWLSGADRGELVMFDQILVELHDLGDVARHTEYAQHLQHINRDFFLFHVHANNFVPLLDLPEGPLPPLLECSFIRKDLCPCHLNETEAFPLAGIDQPNFPDRADPDLDFWPFISGQEKDAESKARRRARHLTNLEHAVTSQRRFIKQLQFENATIKASVLWRFGAPFRFLKNLAKSIAG